MKRRVALGILAATAMPASAQSADSAWAALQKQGAVILFRHAIAPGVGDPSEFQAADCGTQRNLSDEGRVQAQRIGESLRKRAITVQEVWHSAWCRTRDTAQLAFPQMAAPALRPETAFNSFFENRSLESAQTQTARKLLLAWRGPGALVVVTHQVNITALTGVFPQSGEGIVITRENGQLRVAGRLLL